MKFKAHSIDDLLIDVYDHILNYGVENYARKGKNLEVQGCELILSNPTCRVSRSETRGLIFSCLGELFWYLSGSNDVEPIEFYLPMYKTFCEDNGKVHGGYGKRLFSMHDQYDQVARVIEQLKDRPSTRQAVIQLFDSSDLSFNYKDIPCTLNLQFTIRNNKLYMFTMMRSNDAYVGLPHDVFVFTMLQELIASELGYQLGDYHHYVVSLHLYENNLPEARAFINEGYMLHESIMQPMPSKSYSAILNEILFYEQKIRQGEDVDFESVPTLPPYWKDILRLLLFYAQTKKGGIGDLRDALSTKKSIENPNFQTLIEKRTRTHLNEEPKT
ncbi:TPA: thymidylate synthase [Vibrio parahaemolyticus]